MVVLIIISIYITIVILNALRIFIANILIDYCSKQDILEENIPMTKAFNPLYLL